MRVPVASVPAGLRGAFRAAGAGAIADSISTGCARVTISWSDCEEFDDDEV